VAEEAAEREALDTLRESKPEQPGGSQLEGARNLDGLEHAAEYEIAKRVRAWFVAHRALGHRGRRLTNLAVTEGWFGEKSKLPPDEYQFCEACLHGRLARQRRTAESQLRAATAPLEVLHADVAGPFADQGHGGQRFYVAFTCGHTGYIFVYCIPSKDVVPDMLVKLLRTVRTFGSKFDRSRVQVIHADRGSEFTSHAFRAVCLENGVRLQFSNVDHPSQNGVAERTNLTLKSLAQTVIDDSRLPWSVWPYAVEYVATTFNWTPRWVERRHTANSTTEGPLHRNSASPYELLRGERPPLGRMRAFGQRAKGRANRGTSFGRDRAVDLRLVGYSSSSSGWLLWDPRTGNEVDTADVIFDPVYPSSSVLGYVRGVRRSDEELRALEQDNSQPVQRRQGQRSTVSSSSGLRTRSVFDTRDESTDFAWHGGTTYRWTPPRDGGASTLRSQVAPADIPARGPGRARRTLMTNTQAAGEVRMMINQNTKVEYEQDNPKRGESRVRYERYKAATTCAEALSLDSRRADLVYDFAHGYLRRTPDDQGEPPAGEDSIEPDPGPRRRGDATRSPSPPSRSSARSGRSTPGAKSETDQGRRASASQDMQRKRTRPTRAGGTPASTSPRRSERLAALASLESLTYEEQKKRTRATHGGPDDDVILTTSIDSDSDEDLGTDSNYLADSPRDRPVVHRDSTALEGGVEMFSRAQRQAGTERGDDIVETAALQYAYTAYHELTHGLKIPGSMAEAEASPQWESGWLPAIKREMDSMKRMGVYRIVKRPAPGQVKNGKTAKIMTLKDVFDVKLNERGEIVKYKHRLTVRGFLQREGVDYFEKFANTVSYTALRIITSIAATEWKAGCRVYSYDVTTAYLWAKLSEDEEFYVEIPKHGADGHNPATHCWLVQRALYGAVQSARVWGHCFEDFLRGMGYVEAISDGSLFYINEGGETAFLAVYVDDLVLVTSSARLKDKLEKALIDQFDLEPDGNGNRCEWILGIKLTRDDAKDTLSLTQELAVDKLAATVQMSEARPTVVPMQPNVTLVKNEGPEDTSFPYRTAVGALLYISQVTRPDIAYATTVLSRYLQCPGKDHIDACKYLIRHCIGTRTLGLKYHGSGPRQGVGNKLTAFADAAFADDITTRSSTCGFVVMLNGAAVAWQSKLPKSAVLSTTQAEVSALVAVTKELMGLRVMMDELGYPQRGSSHVGQDNQGAIAQARGVKHGRRAKHYLVQLHWMKQKVAAGDVHLSYVKTNDMAADLMTKALPGPALTVHRDHILGGAASEFHQEDVLTATDLATLIVDCLASGSSNGEDTDEDVGYDLDRASLENHDGSSVEEDSDEGVDYDLVCASLENHDGSSIEGPSGDSDIDHVSMLTDVEDQEPPAFPATRSGRRYGAVAEGEATVRRGTRPSQACSQLSASDSDESDWDQAPIHEGNGPSEDGTLEDYYAYTGEDGDEPGVDGTPEDYYAYAGEASSDEDSDGSDPQRREETREVYQRRQAQLVEDRREQSSSGALLVSRTGDPFPRYDTSVLENEYLSVRHKSWIVTDMFDHWTRVLAERCTGAGAFGVLLPEDDVRAFLTETQATIDFLDQVVEWYDGSEGAYQALTTLYRTLHSNYGTLEGIKNRQEHDAADLRAEIEDLHGQVTAGLQREVSQQLDAVNLGAEVTDLRDQITAGLQREETQRTHIEDLNSRIADLEAERDRPTVEVRGSRTEATPAAQSSVVGTPAEIAWALRMDRASENCLEAIWQELINRVKDQGAAASADHDSAPGSATRPATSGNPASIHLASGRRGGTGSRHQLQLSLVASDRVEVRRNREQPRGQTATIRRPGTPYHSRCSERGLLVASEPRVSPSARHGTDLLADLTHAANRRSAVRGTAPLVVMHDVPSARPLDRTGSTGP